MPDNIITSDSGINSMTYESYTVKSGDTLEKIATEFGVSVAILIQLNDLSIPETGGAIIEEGQVLTVPKFETTYAPSAVSAPGGSAHITGTPTAPLTTATETVITVGHPYAKVSITTETGMLTLQQDLAITSNNFDGDILAINTSRDMAQDCPTFNLRVVYRHDWYNMIGSNDMIVIFLHRPPDEGDKIFFGLVDDIRRSTDFSTGKPIRSFDITGRGFNKALVQFTVGAIAELAGIEAESGLGFMGNMTDIFTGKSPAEIVAGILQHYLTKGCNYQFADGTTFLSHYQQFIFDNDDVEEMLENSMSFLNYQGSLWQLLKEVKNAPFNEMFWEIQNGKPTFIFRPTPFNPDSWGGLTCVNIKDKDIVSENVGRSDLETYVVYSVKGTSFISNVTLTVFPLWYEPYYPKYGITRLQVNSKFIGTDEEGGDALILKRQHDIFNWNIKNNSMENGTIVVKGSPVYRVGTRIFLESTGIEYYVENVSHTFNLYQNWITTLSVTRGVAPDKRFSAPWGCGVQMTPEDASKIYGYDITQAANWSGTVVDPYGNSGNYSGGVNNPSGVGSNYGSTGATNVTLTGQPNYDLVNVGLGEIGNNEADGTHVKYIKAYDKTWGSGTAWCACFVSWCARQAGIPTSEIPQFASCTTGMKWYKGQNRWQTSQGHGGSTSYTPKPGDVIFFNWNGSTATSDHVGIVVKCENGVVTTVEGNTSDRVDTRTYNIKSTSIIGYGVSI